MINWSIAREMTAGDETLLVDVIAAFQQETPTLLDAMGEAISTHDAKRLHRAAHTLKNSLWSLGATAGGDTAFLLEQLASEEQWDGTDTLYQNLESLLPAIYEELDRYVRTRDSHD